MRVSAISDLIQTHLGRGVLLSADQKASPPALRAIPESIADICQLLHSHPTTYFDYLACITALDNGPALNTLEIIYNLYSIPYNLQLMLKIAVTRNKFEEPLPTVPTVSHIWQAANWHEREAYDLLGIYFVGHPDLRRILLPADWQGYPLRQDYQLQEQYHGIQTSY
jgi:NADH-quinone oxidoreductase subunit C